MEKVNLKEESYEIAEKLDASSKRNNLSNYRDYLYEDVNQEDCFYCSKKTIKSALEVDHFIPWSFVEDDKLWNFVLSCRECNNKKRDRLAAEDFIIKITNRNKQIISYHNPVVENDFKGYTDK